MGITSQRKNAGRTVWGVRQARMSVPQITRPHLTEVNSWGIYDAVTIAKTFAP